MIHKFLWLPKDNNVLFREKEVKCLLALQLKAVLRCITFSLLSATTEICFINNFYMLVAIVCILGMLPAYLWEVGVEGQCLATEFGVEGQRLAA